MNNILIGGVFYGLHNIGDEAILQSMIRSLSVYNRVYYLTYGSEWAKDMFPQAVSKKIDTVYAKPKLGIIYTRKPIFNLPKAMFKTFFPDLSNYRGMDLYVCGGATILSDCPWYSLRSVLIAKKAGVPSVLWGVGMAVVNESKTLKFIKKVCNDDCVKYIFTRDEYSKSRLIQCGVKEEKIDICYDPAIMLKPSDSPLSEYLNSKEIIKLKGDGNKICISISGEKDVAERTPIDEIQAYIGELLRDTKNTIFLIPTGHGTHVNDKKILNQLVVSDKIVMVEKEFKPEDLIHFLEFIDVIVSSRLHLNIFGAVVGTPSIGLVRNEKIIDFAKIFSLPILELENLKKEKLLLETYKILKNSTELRKNILLKKDKLRKIQEKAMRKLNETL